LPTAVADIESLRAAGFDDEPMLAMTAHAALRLAFSMVNNALGAHPDWQFRNSTDPRVLAAIGYGLPIGVVPATEKSRWGMTRIGSPARCADAAG
jgi:hypothetical protein